MSGDHTPNLDLEYLAPSQAQPEVIINDAWNKIDEAVAGGITVADVNSPHTIVTGVKTLRIIGGHVTAESDGAALLTVDGSSPESTNVPAGGAISIEGLDESPHVIIHDVELLKVSGAAIEQETDGSVLMTIAAAPPSEFVLSAGWNSSSGAVPIAFTVPQDLMLPRAATLEEIFIQTQGPTGSCTVALSWSAFPFVSGADITGGTPPAISSGTSYSNAMLAGYTIAFAQAVIIRATLSANTNFTSIKIFLRFK